MLEILVLYYSQGGSTAEMARTIAHGVEEIDGSALSGTALTTRPEVDHN